MRTKIDELKVWRAEAKDGLRHEANRLEEKGRQINSYMRMLDAMDELVSEIEDLREESERKQEEIDDLSKELELKDKVIDDLQRQLLEAKNQHLESENQHLEAEANSKPMEIHNHFESGSRSQVFNDKVNGRFTRNQKVKKDKKDKKRWKKIVRRVL